MLVLQLESRLKANTLLKFNYFILSVCNCLYVGVISGALLQLRTEFDLDCQQTELVVSALLIGALIASFTGGLSVCLSVGHT